MLYLKLIWTLCGVRCCLGKLFTVYLIFKKLDLNMCSIDLGQIDETYTVPRLLELCAFKLVVLVTSQRSIRLYTLLPCELVNACCRPEDKMITSMSTISFHFVLQTRLPWLILFRAQLEWIPRQWWRIEWQQYLPTALDSFLHWDIFLLQQKQT